jgi:predicted transposase
MLLTLKVKLQPTEEHRQKLLKTMETFNRACDEISKIAYESKSFNRYRLHHRLYHRIRSSIGCPPNWQYEPSAKSLTATRRSVGAYTCSNHMEPLPTMRG